MVIINDVVVYIQADVVQMASPAQAETTQAYTEGAITCRYVKLVVHSSLCNNIRATDAMRPSITIRRRVYDYESERRCDAHVATFLDCIDAVKNVTPEGFAAIKVRTTVP